MASFSQEHITSIPMARSPADDGSPLGELFNILRRRKWIIFTVVVLLTGLAVLYGLQIVPTYTATALVMVETRESHVVDVEQVLPGLGLSPTDLENQVNLVESHDLIVQTMEELDLFNDPEFGAVAPEEDSQGATASGGRLRAGAEWLWEQWRVAKALAAESLLDLRRVTIGGAEEADISVGSIPPEETARRIAVATFAGNLYVARRGDANVLSISFTSLEPVKAARIANQLANLYVENQLQEKRRATSRANLWLSERLKALQEEVLEAERAAARFQAENQLIAARGTALSETQLAELNQELIRMRAEKAEEEAKLRLIRELRASGDGLDSIAEVVASPLISDLRRQEAELMRQQAELATTYGARHPQMQALREERANLAAGIRDEVNRIIRSLENELTVIATREQNLDQELQAAKSASALDSQAEVRLRELEREAAAKRTLYETLLTRYQETKTQEGLLEPDARMIFPAEVPWGPSTPSPKIFAAVGFTASAVFGCMLALLLEQLDNSLRSSRQVERVLQVPCLSLIPSVRGLKRNQTLHGYLRDKPRSAYAEGLRALYSATFVSEPSSPPKVILVTSALPGEGKTSVSSSLAAFVGRLGRKTLLIDLDLRRPGIARAFGLQSASGVVEVIAEDRSLEEALVSDDATGIDILPAHRSPADPTALLMSQRLHSLLRELRDQYDCIVVDSPPLLGLTDAQTLSPFVDTTIFVVQWERTKRDAAVAGIKRLKDVSASIAGAVLTQVDLKKQARYRYGDAAQYYDKYRKYYVN